MIRRARALAALAAFAVASPASADDSKLDAKSLMQTGVKLLDAKDYRGALAVFKDAYTRFASAKILLNIGTTLKLLDRKAEAANAYQRYLDSADADPGKRAEVTAAIAELDHHVGRLALTITPPEAEVQIGDDEWVPAAQAKLVRVAPGSIAVRARTPGYDPGTATVDAGLGTETPVALALTATRIPAAPPAGDLLGTLGPVEPLVDTGPRPRLGALALAHLDPANKGAAAVVGVTYDLTSRLGLRAAAILGPAYGGYVGATFAFATGQLRPLASAGVPVFASSGARWSVRAAGGVEIVASRHVSFIVELGVEHPLNREMGIKALLFIPAVGAAGRL